jgi:hypothetical protein
MLNISCDINKLFFLKVLFFKRKLIVQFIRQIIKDIK